MNTPVLPLRPAVSFGFRVSVAVNVALLAVGVALFLRDRSPKSVDRPAPLVSAERRTSPAKTAAAATGAARNTAGGGLTPEAVARFEQAGVSRRILADIVRLDFQRRWGKRIVELENRYAPKSPPQREYIALQRRHDEAEIRELKQAFGEEGYLAWDKEETLRKLNFEDVPMDPAEADQAYRLQKQLDDKLRQLQMAMEDGDADISDMGTLQQQAQDAYEKELEKLLGRQHYEQLKGYTLAVVEGHLEFNELKPSAEQVNALKGADSEYRARETALARRLREKPADATALAAELQALNDARDENFRHAVGASAYEQLKREHDMDYQALTQYAPAWNLKENEIGPVYDKVKAYRDYVDRLRQAEQMNELAGHAPDWKTINSVIDRARQQTEAALQNLIGDERLGRLKRNGMLSPLGSDRNAPHPPQGG